MSMVELHNVPNSRRVRELIESGKIIPPPPRDCEIALIGGSLDEWIPRMRCCCSPPYPEIRLHRRRRSAGSRGAACGLVHSDHASIEYCRFAPDLKVDVVADDVEFIGETPAPSFRAGSVRKRSKQTISTEKSASTVTLPFFPADQWRIPHKHVRGGRNRL